MITADNIKDKAGEAVKAAGKVVKNVTPTRILMFGGGAILFVIAVNQVRNWFDRDEGEVYDKDIQNNELSYAMSQYQIFADTIQLATSTIADDEDAIFNVFSQLYNDSDVLQLVRAFDRRTYWGGTGFFYNASLAEVINTKLDDSEIANINQIMASNYVTIRF